MYERSFRFGEPQRGIEPPSPIWRDGRHTVRPLRLVPSMCARRIRKWQNPDARMHRGSVDLASSLTSVPALLDVGISKNVQVFEENAQTGAKCGQMGK